jgi:twitching motility protein PilJ
MSQASDRQAQAITTVAGAAIATSSQLQNVAGRAEQLAAQAQASVEIANSGAGTVGRTIQSMTVLREQIQDTAKRIKRLGESSQEIGNITELINDIADQTNTLALNASIQAAMAGEQGRGFAVVADEVQRLAERAGSATRKIDNLVKTIQADTNEVITSMERSTANVVLGAKSAEEAGQSLSRIETSSQELAKVIQEISLAARGQSAEATRIADSMQSIREIAVQTSGSAARTSQAVGELNKLSDQLRESVAGFTLPPSEALGA